MRKINDGKYKTKIRIEHSIREILTFKESNTNFLLIEKKLNILEFGNPQI